MPKADPDKKPTTKPEEEKPVDPVELVKRYLIPASDDVVRQLAEQLGPEGVKMWAQEQAAALFPNIAPQVQAGGEPRLLLEPMRMIASQELERDVSLDDPILRDVIYSPQPMTLAQVRDYVRQQPEWDETSGAERMTSQLIRNINGETGGAV